MERGLIFWVIMLLWGLCLLGAAFGEGSWTHWAMVGGQVGQFVLFSLLGWQVFGPAVK
jgi:hypothetical protein